MNNFAGSQGGSGKGSDEIEGLDAGNVGEVGKERDGVKRNCIDARNGVCDEVVDTIVKDKKRSLYTVPVGKDRIETSRLLEKWSAKYPDRFVEGFSSDEFVGGKRLKGIMADPRFRGKFTRWRTLALKPEKKSIPEYNELEDELQEAVLGEKTNLLVKKKYRDRLNRYVVFERRGEIGKILFSFGKKEEVGVLNENMRLLDAQHQRGEISDREYFKKIDGFYDEAIASSDDQELKKLWGSYKEEEKDYGENLFSDVIPVSDSEVVVEDEKEIDNALGDVKESGISFELNKDGNIATVSVGDGFSVNVVIYRNSETKDYVYYLRDDYAGKSVRTDRKGLLSALDKRYLDAYISKKVQLKAVNKKDDFISDVPDSDLSRLGEKLIGEGGDRNYRIEGENMEVLDALAKILVADDKKYGSFYRKVEILNKFFKMEDLAKFAKKRLLQGEVSSVTDLVEGKTV